MVLKGNLLQIVLISMIAYLPYHHFAAIFSQLPL